MGDIAVWDGYTLDGKLIFGRNWDIDRQTMRDYMRYLAVTIFHPLEGYAFANIHPLGNVYLETGMNRDAGLLNAVSEKRSGLWGLTFSTC